MSHIITGPPHIVQGASIVLLSGVCHRRLLSVVVCNTPRWACTRLHPCRPDDDVMPPPV